MELLESEVIRKKLQTILEPGGEMGALTLADVVDAPPLQIMADSFHSFTNLPIWILDLKGKVLVGGGWQEICAKFPRLHPGKLQSGCE